MHVVQVPYRQGLLRSSVNDRLARAPFPYKASSQCLATRPIVYRRPRANRSSNPARSLLVPFPAFAPMALPHAELLNIPTQTARPVRRLAALTRRIRSDTYPTFKRAAPVVLVSRYSLVRVVRSSSHQSLGSFTTTLKLCPPGTNPGIVRGGLASILARRPSPVQLKKPYKRAPPRRRSAAGATGSDRGYKFVYLVIGETVFCSNLLPSR